MEDDRENSSTNDQSLIPGPRLPPDSFTLLETALHLPEEAGTDSKPPVSQTDVFRALEVVERDSLAIAQSYTSLFDSLRLALSEATKSSVDHMQCFNDAAGRLQESVLDAATKGNRYINSCLRLNEEMKGVDSLASQLACSDDESVDGELKNMLVNWCLNIFKSNMKIRFG